MCPYGGTFDSDDGVDLKVSEIYTLDEVDNGVSQDAIARELLIEAINHAASSDTVIVEGANNDDWIEHALKTHMGETVWLRRDTQDISVNSLVRPHRQNRMARPHRHEQPNANHAGFLTRMFAALRKG